MVDVPVFTDDFQRADSVTLGPPWGFAGTVGASLRVVSGEAVALTPYPGPGYFSLSSGNPSPAFSFGLLPDNGLSNYSVRVTSALPDPILEPVALYSNQDNYITVADVYGGPAIIVVVGGVIVSVGDTLLSPVDDRSLVVQGNEVWCVNSDDFGFTSTSAPVSIPSGLPRTGIAGMSWLPYYSGTTQTHNHVTLFEVLTPGMFGAFQDGRTLFDR